jgi:hypothetical protein
MLDTTTWPGTIDNYVDALVWLVSELLGDPKHSFRSFTVRELGRLMTARPTEPLIRAHEMGIYKRCSRRAVVDFPLLDVPTRAMR